MRARWNKFVFKVASSRRLWEEIHYLLQELKHHFVTVSQPNATKVWKEFITINTIKYIFMKDLFYTLVWKKKYYFFFYIPRHFRRLSIMVLHNFRSILTLNTLSFLSYNILHFFTQACYNGHVLFTSVLPACSLSYVYQISRTFIRLYVA